MSKTIYLWLLLFEFKPAILKFCSKQSLSLRQCLLTCHFSFNSCSIIDAIWWLFWCFNCQELLYWGPFSGMRSRWLRCVHLEISFIHCWKIITSTTELRWVSSYFLKMLGFRTEFPLHSICNIWCGLAFWSADDFRLGSNTLQCMIFVLSWI